MCYSGKCHFESWDGDCCEINHNEKIIKAYGYSVCTIGGYYNDPDEFKEIESIDKDDIKKARKEIKKGHYLNENNISIKRSNPVKEVSSPSPIQDKKSEEVNVNDGI